MQTTTLTNNIFCQLYIFMFLIGSTAKFLYNYMYDKKSYLLSEKICYCETCLTPTNWNPVDTEL